jgi:hypothetical protein
MVRYPRVVEHVLAAVLLCAALLAPSLANAHGGHMHHASAAALEPAAPPAGSERMAGKPATISSAARHEIARAAVPASDPDLSDCVSHCCSGTANMACCGAALIPEIAVVPAFTASHRLLFGQAGALLGLPPEALPKPPRPFV